MRSLPSDLADLDLRMEIMDRAERIAAYADEEADPATCQRLARHELRMGSAPVSGVGEAVSGSQSSEKPKGAK